MKKLIHVYLLLLIVLATSCNSDVPEPEPADTFINYSSSTLNGQNILSLSDSSSVDASGDYAFAASLGEDAGLKVKIYNLSTEIPGQSRPVWLYGGKTGWHVSDYDSTGIQTFTSISTGNIDAKFSFSKTGACKIEVYENESSAPVSKHLTWN